LLESPRLSILAADDSDGDVLEVLAGMYGVCTEVGFADGVTAAWIEGEMLSHAIIGGTSTSPATTAGVFWSMNVIEVKNRYQPVAPIAGSSPKTPNEKTGKRMKEDQWVKREEKWTWECRNVHEYSVRVYACW
jgi:hypothetical protein